MLDSVAFTWRHFFFLGPQGGYPAAKTVGRDPSETSQLISGPETKEEQHFHFCGPEVLLMDKGQHRGAGEIRRGWVKGGQQPWKAAAKIRGAEWGPSSEPLGYIEPTIKCGERERRHCGL